MRLCVDTKKYPNAFLVEIIIIVIIGETLVFVSGPGSVREQYAYEGSACADCTEIVPSVMIAGLIHTLRVR